MKQLASLKKHKKSLDAFCVRRLNLLEQLPMPGSKSAFIFWGILINGTFNFSYFCNAEFKECEQFVQELQTREARRKGEIARDESVLFLQKLEGADADLIEETAAQVLNQWNEARKKLGEPAIAAHTLLAAAKLQNLSPTEASPEYASATASLQYLLEQDPYFRSIQSASPLEQSLESLPGAIRTLAAQHTSFSVFETHLFSNSHLRCGPNLAALSVLQVFEPQLDEHTDDLIKGLIRVSRRRMYLVRHIQATLNSKHPLTWAFAPDAEVGELRLSRFEKLVAETVGHHFPRSVWEQLVELLGEPDNGLFVNLSEELQQRVVEDGVGTTPLPASSYGEAAQLDLKHIRELLGLNQEITDDALVLAILRIRYLGYNYIPFLFERFQDQLMRAFQDPRIGKLYLEAKMLTNWQAQHRTTILDRTWIDLGIQNKH